MGKITVNCKSCGDSIELPAPPRPRITIFGLSGLFSEFGVFIVLIVCCSLPMILGAFNDGDTEYRAIKKALESPGVKIEITKGDGDKVNWKIVTEPPKEAAKEQR